MVSNLYSSLLLYGLALQAVYNLHRAVSFTPIDTVEHVTTVDAAGSHRRHKADVRSHHAVVHGQLGGDPLHTLVYGDLHAVDITAARVPCRPFNRDVCSIVVWIKQIKTCGNERRAS